MGPEILIVLGVILLFAGLMNYAKNRETKAFNGGECPDCKVPWRHFDNDSQGGRGYTCDSCPRGVWVSYKRVDK